MSQAVSQCVQVIAGSIDSGPDKEEGQPGERQEQAGEKGRASAFSLAAQDAVGLMSVRHGKAVES
ncbi:MAG: hypothetical protein RBR73_05300 [Halothiobacillaceae bacterium]|nr:hypothetical protein [Halothiobacillaceae bacterium]